MTDKITNNLMTHPKKSSKHITKISVNSNLSTVKIKTESNTLGLLKTLVVLALIMLQGAIFIGTYVLLSNAFHWVAIVSFMFSFIACISVLSSNKSGQVKATWILFLLICSSFGFIVYLMSDERILFRTSKRKYNTINKETNYLIDESITAKTSAETAELCNYLHRAGRFPTYTNCKTEYFSSGASLFDDILAEMKTAKEFIFIEYFIISNGTLLKRMLDILKEKSASGVDIRIIYDDMGSHHTIPRKLKKQIISCGIKLKPFNKLVPMFNIALNLRDHRKIVVIDGKTAYTGGANLADEYINEKRMHGYWKDCGIKLQGACTNRFTLAFLRQWHFITGQAQDYKKYLNKHSKFENSAVVVPFVDGPHLKERVGRNAYINMIASAKKHLYIMSPYFIPDETILSLLETKAKSGVDVKLILPDIADKKFVYYVSRSTAERLIEHGVKVYTMTKSFVHSKVVLNENACIVGSINVDQRSFTQQFESAVLTNDKSTLKQVHLDFEKTISTSHEITSKNKKSNNLFHRILAGIFRIIAPFM